MPKEKNKSFLAGNIKPIIQFAGECDTNKVAQEIEKLKQTLEDKLSQLKREKNLRIYDGNNGGCLRGPKKTRQTSQLGTELLCNVNYMTHGKNNKPSEVPYMRALFNLDGLCNYKIISYETPFMRKKKENINPDIGGRLVSCDLLGLNEDELCCIEVKTVPDKPATFIPYALLEGFSYAVCLKWIKDNCRNELLKEIDLCCDDFKITQNFNIESLNINFAIAGPQQEYFNPYITKKMMGHKPLYFEKKLNQAICIEEILDRNYSGLFKGYMFISYSVDDCKGKEQKNKIVKPYFDTIQNACTIVSSIKKFPQEIC